MPDWCGHEYDHHLTQLKYHEKHIRICLSDLNDNALAMASTEYSASQKEGYIRSSF